MKTLITILLAILAFGQTTYAQTADVKRLEGELYIGASAPLTKINESNLNIGPMLGVELRYNFENSPFDVGLNLGMTTAIYGFDNGYGGEEPSTYDYSQSNRTAFIALMSDYNFHQGGKINPFIGVGIGIGTHDALNDVVYEVNEGGTAVFIPRAGIEFARHFRMSLSAQLSKKCFHNINLSIGVVFGGGLSAKR